ncbi:MAG: RNA polymerase sigma factor [Flavobacteriales bacterium]|nr:RNA polymerase sigma factor [Flavobacteriales bacterium]MBK7269080.1 RNA polymerase sigma factor [Flavobacteriales bacterium]
MGLLGTNHRSASDERLMELVVRGDEKAFVTIYDRYHGRVLNYFHRMLWQDRQRSQDFMQDLFTKIAHKPTAYDASRPFSTWLFSVANNMCKNEYRREEVRRAAVPELRHNGTAVLEAKGGEAVDREHFRHRLEEELDRLDPDHKATFVMRYEEDLAIKEIALAFGISEGTVKSRLFYTLKKLAERLKEFGPLPLPHHGQA